MRSLRAASAVPLPGRAQHCVLLDTRWQPSVSSHETLKRLACWRSVSLDIIACGHTYTPRLSHVKPLRVTRMPQNVHSAALLPALTTYTHTQIRHTKTPSYNTSTRQSKRASPRSSICCRPPCTTRQRSCQILPTIGKGSPSIATDIHCNLLRGGGARLCSVGRRRLQLPWCTAPRTGCTDLAHPFSPPLAPAAYPRGALCMC